MTAGADEKIQRIGILEMAAPDSERLALWEIFKRRLHELGHTEGTGIELQFRWAEGHTERLAAAAAELIALMADVLVTAGTPRRRRRAAPPPPFQSSWQPASASARN